MRCIGSKLNRALPTKTLSKFRFVVFYSGWQCGTPATEFILTVFWAIEFEVVVGVVRQVLSRQAEIGASPIAIGVTWRGLRRAVSAWCAHSRESFPPPTNPILVLHLH